MAWPAYAQRTRNERDPNRQRIDKLREQERFEERERQLHALEEMLNSPDVKKDAERTRQREILQDFQQLNEASEKLLALFATPAADDKKTAELAGKIAKLSKRLRSQLELKADKQQSHPEQVAAGTDRHAHMRQMAETIDKAVKEVNEQQSEIVYTVDVKGREGAGKQLVMIEAMADNLREFARRK